MTPDNGSHLILCTSYGERSAHACSMDNARALLAQHLGTLDAEVLECASVLAGTAASPAYLVSSELVARALQEVAESAAGAAAPKLRRLLHGAPPKDAGTPDARPEVTVSAEMKDALALWAFKAGLTAHQLTADHASTLVAAQPMQLAFLAPLLERAGNRALRFTPNYILDGAAELKQLQTGQWKPTALEHRVVGRYLEFINSWLVDTSDVRYDVIELQASVS